jgi:hypothetical protein
LRFFTDQRPDNKGAQLGSARYLWDARSVNAAIAYVVEGQDVAR